MRLAQTSRTSWQVVLHEPGQPSEVVYLCGSRIEALQFIRECRNETIGCEFSVHPGTPTEQMQPVIGGTV